MKKTVVSNGVKGKKARVYFPNHNKMFEEYEIHETSSFSAQLKNKFPSILSFVGTAVSDPKKRVNFTYSKYTGLQATFEQTDRIPLKLVKANDESVYQLYWASDIQRTDEERIHCDLDTERDHRKLFDPKKTISAKKKLLK
ncbi:MAG: hypothetical protein ABF270_04095 [Flavobacteriales bacterium]